MHHVQHDFISQRPGFSKDQTSMLNYYANLNEKDLTDNKKFWRTVKPLLSDEIKLSGKIILVEQRETLDTDGNIDDGIVNEVKIFNRFFSNTVIDLKIPDFYGAVRLADNISHRIFKAMLKYANHPSTITIKDLNNASMFSFSNASGADVEREIRKLDPRKATQNTDIPVRILKQNFDIFGSYICDFFNECVDKGVFPSILKNAYITPVFNPNLGGEGVILPLPLSWFSLNNSKTVKAVTLKFSSIQ